MAILTAYSGERIELSLTEISRASGLPTSTAHRLVQELVECGALERTPSGRYVVGLNLWGIAARAPHSFSLGETAMPYLQQLLDETGCHVHLAVLHGPHALVLEKLSPPQADERISRAGSHIPLHATATGQVLLAYGPLGLLDSFLRAPLDAYTHKTLTRPEELRNRVAVIRRQGVSRSCGELVTGLDGCAAPVFGEHRTLVGSIGAIVASDSAPLQEVEQGVRAAARALTESLNGPAGKEVPGPLFRPLLRHSNPNGKGDIAG
ncbi:IclR family transcriptional regulator [Arthrobacter crystallopoietes]|uniref:IclR family transcriptional regulator n=1 Tax=Crystallibacter crystallopoietes TaxID=37928 RepID=UPI003D22531A